MFDFGNANSKQIEAIQHTDGPLLIIAGPGTGKTFTLVKRTIYLLIEKKLKPENLMIVTFTEKAAGELISRISDEMFNQGIDMNIDEMFIGTFHSICLNILKDNISKTVFKNNIRVIDDFEQIYLIYQNIDKFDEVSDIQDIIYGGITSKWNRSKTLQGILNSAFEEMLDINSLLTKGTKSEHTVAGLMNIYSDLLIEDNCIDFAHIQYEFYQLVSNDSGIRSKLVEKIKYIMIDEYQDTNYIQEQIIFKLLNVKNNICVVGDDDQGLYRFRGATIRNILEFPTKFDNIKRIYLSQNYRSEKQIVDFYNNWMKTTETESFSFLWDKFRFDKEILPSKSNLFLEESVFKLTSDNNFTELGERIVDFIQNLKNSKSIEDYSQIAFLFRSVKSDKIVKLYRYLENSGIPVYSPRSNLFFYRDEIKLLVGLLMIIFPQYLKKITEKKEDDLREVHKYLLECVIFGKGALKLDTHVELKKWVRYRAKDHMFLNKRTEYSFSTLIYQIFQFEPFKTFMDADLALLHSPTRELTNISIFLEMVARFEYLHNTNHFSPKNMNWTLYSFFEQYLRFMIEGGVSEFEDKERPFIKGAVSFLTIHQSKGLEFPIVFVGSQNAVPRKQNLVINDLVNENLFNRKAFEPEGMVKYYDFWRLFYTAYSRAKNQLILFANVSGGRWKEPSKYFEHLYEGLNDAKIMNIEYDINKDSNIKKTYSFTSDIQTYENCSVQYKFFKELNFTPIRMGSFIFGTLVHQTIEDIHNEVLEGNLDNLNEVFIEKHFNLNYEAISKKEHMFLTKNVRKGALVQVLNYYHARKSEFSELIDVEVPLSHVRDSYIIKGKVDLLRRDSNYHIVDFKTEKKPDMEKDREKIDRNMRQLEIYAYLFEKAKGISVDYIDNYYTSEINSNPVVSRRVNLNSLESTILKFDDIVNKIDQKRFSTRTKNIRHCRNCDLKFYCKKV